MGGLGEKVPAVEADAPGAPIEEAKSVEIAPDTYEALIEVEKAIEVAPEAPEAPIDEEKTAEIVPEAPRLPLRRRRLPLLKCPMQWKRRHLKP